MRIKSDNAIGVKRLGQGNSVKFYAYVCGSKFQTIQPDKHSQLRWEDLR